MIKTELILGCSSIDEVIGNQKALSDFYAVGTDTRNFKPGEFFLAIKGEKFDGFQFVEQIIDKTDLIVLENNKENKNKVLELCKNYSKKLFVLVNNSIKYTQELASAHVQNWLKKSNKEIIAIAGSNGKTTTKEMLWHLLSSINDKNVTGTLRNNNNHLGVPFTLFQITEDIDFAVVEYGSNHPGEMKVICECSHPTIAVSTNIGDTHMEFFDDLEAVFEEESLAYQYISQSKYGKKIFFKNSDDFYLSKLENSSFTKTYGLKGSPDFKFVFDRESQSIAVNGIKIENKNILGGHNFFNLALSYVIANELYPGKSKELLEACAHFSPRPNRSEWRRWKTSKLFLDAYNANPSSMKQAASEFYEVFLKDGPKDENCLMVVGDMNELGEKAPKYHEELGEFLTSLEKASVVFLGRYKDHFQKGYKGNLLICQEGLSLTPEQEKQIESHSWIFAKASRSLQLESLFAIKERST